MAQKATQELHDRHINLAAYIYMLGVAPFSGCNCGKCRLLGIPKPKHEIILVVTGILAGRPHPIYLLNIYTSKSKWSSKYQAAHFWVPVPWPSISKMIWHSHEVSKETWNKGFSHMTTSPLTKSLEATKMRPLVGCFSTCTSPSVSALMKHSMDLQIAWGPHFWGVSPRGHGWHSQHKWLPKISLLKTSGKVVAWTVRLSNQVSDLDDAITKQNLQRSTQNLGEF